VPRKADAAERKWLAFFARHEIIPSDWQPSFRVLYTVPWLIESQLSADNHSSAVLLPVGSVAHVCYY
jgi:hypothetical protein